METINRIRRLEDLCEVVEGELVEQGYSFLAGKVAAMALIAASLERALEEDSNPISSTGWIHEADYARE